MGENVHKEELIGSELLAAQFVAAEFLGIFDAQLSFSSLCVDVIGTHTAKSFSLPGDD